MAPRTPAADLQVRRPAIGRVVLHDEVAVRLRDMILEGELPPGARIPEAQLCATFGVSRTPLREALKVLAAEGLVELFHNRGAIVKRVSVEEISDIFEVMAGLEYVTGQLLCQRATAEQVAELQELHAKLADFHNRGRRSDYFRTNQKIHRQIAETAGNRVLAELHTDFSGKIRRARYMANLTQARWDESLHEHEAFMQALAERDGERMGQALRDHMRRTGDVVIQALRGDGGTVKKAARGKRRSASTGDSALARIDTDRTD